MIKVDNGKFYLKGESRTTDGTDKDFELKKKTVNGLFMMMKKTVVQDGLNYQNTSQHLYMKINYLNKKK